MSQLSRDKLFGPTCSAAVSPASQSQQPTLHDAEEMMSDGSGRSFLSAFAAWDRSTSLWKMFGDSSRKDSLKFSGAWPVSGMTRSGIAFRLPRSVPLMYEIESFSWPTPVASDGSGGASLTRSRDKWKLCDAARHTDGPGPLNPVLSEWLMGFPKEWTDLSPSETP